MAKKPPQHAAHWLSKLGDNERKLYDKHKYFDVNNANNMYMFLWLSFRPRDKEAIPELLALIDRHFPKL
jgi:hypothetical protein